MSFKLSLDEPVNAGIKRMAIEQIEAAREMMLDRSIAADKRIHATRQSCKRLRGIMRLVRPVLADYRRDNAAVGEAAGRLSAARDAHVLIETFDALVAGGGNTLVLSQEMIRAELVARSVSADGEDKDALLTTCAASLARVQGHVSGWKISKSGFGAIQDGLVVNYGEARKALDLAWRKREDEAFHTARKHIKYYWHHLSILRNVAPELLKTHRDMANSLGTMLGDHHNLAVFKQTVMEEPEAFGGQGAVRAAVGASLDMQDRLAGDIFGLGLQLLVEKPDALGARFRQHWRMWRKREPNGSVLR